MQINNQGWELAALFLCCLFFVVLVTHWSSFSSILRVKGQEERETGNFFEKTLLRTKLLLLKVCGASDIDITHDDDEFLDATRIQETYFIKYPARVAWQLFSYYMVYCFVLVLLARPIDMFNSQTSGELVAFSLNLNGKEQIISIIILAATNVATDILSLAITYSHITKIANLHSERSNFAASLVAVKDIFYAFSLFLLSQLISNILYPLSIENPPSDFNPFSIGAALMPYAFIADASGMNIQFHDFVFPGQLFITGTAFVPTLLVMLLILTIGLLSTILRIVHWAQAKVISDGTLLEILYPTGPDDLALRLPSRARKCFAFAVQAVMMIFTSLVGSLILLFLRGLF
uniref:Uncharacterized protein n=1 Tax=Candidatus Kentrum sp. DK TaxID=2126562 RepID=A0A450RYP7_9GAMM|nr:MAG: hypothetical protein BECKDK2373C_GA0170839_100769 [Candidatus Kentron sp. DK]